MKTTRVEHVGIAVRSIEQAAAFYRLLGLEISRIRRLEKRGVNIAFLPVGDCQIELLEPERGDSDVGRFLQANGEGMHHICLGVEDVDGAVRELMETGVPMRDEVPRMGSRGRRLAFVDPTTAHGVLVELIED